MKNSRTQLTFVKTELTSLKTAASALFRKTADCPASSTLLSFQTEKLSRKGVTEVREHLGYCEFCNAELRLLAHHTRDSRSPRPPEIPMNLRILAESILSQKV